MKRNSIKTKNKARLDEKERTNKVSIFVFAGLIIAVAGWIFYTSKPKTPPTIISLQDNWQAMEASAHDLQSDAQLSNLAIYLADKSPFELVAEYNSSTYPDKTMIVGIESNGEITASWLDIPSSSNSSAQDQNDQSGWYIIDEKEQINRQDWVVDSQVAFDIFSKNETVSYCLKSNRDSIELSLLKDYTDIIVWELTIWECPEKGKIETYQINALTGEFIE